MWPYGVVLVLFGVFTVFTIVPFLRLFQLAFLSWPDVLAGRASGFTTDNFAYLAGDPNFRQALLNTAIFTTIRVPIGIILGLAVALGMRRMNLLRPLFLTAWFSPFITSVVAMALVFTYLFNPTFGLFNYLLGGLGIQPQGFLRDPNQALLSIALVDLWKTVGFTAVVFLAGLTGIPDVYYEAAKVDGAGPIRTLLRITLPLLSRTTYLLLVVGVITSMRLFVPVYMMTGFSLSAGGLGGPLGRTNVLVLYMYQSAFRFNNFGHAAAAALALFVIVLAVTLLQLRFLRTKWEY